MRLARRMLAMGMLGSSTTYPEVTAYYSSPGGAGDYMDAATNAAARAVFGGAGVTQCTVFTWAKEMIGPNFCTARDADGAPLSTFLNEGDLGVDMKDALSTEFYGYALAAPNTESWTFCVRVVDATTLTVYSNGVADGDTDAIAGTYAACDIFEVFTPNVSGKLCQPGIIARALSGAEIASIYAAGPTVDIRNTIGAVDFLWRDADTAGSVANVGTGAACALTIHGSVTSEAL